jgi:hypothetical protein
MSPCALITWLGLALLAGGLVLAFERGLHAGMDRVIDMSDRR